MHLMTPKEVAETLSVPIQTLTQWRYQGRGPSFVKAGRLVRYKREDVDSWIQANTVQTTKAA